MGATGTTSATSATGPTGAIGRVAVVGGGVSGLAAAYRLRQRGVPVSLFEAGPHAGGAIRSDRDAGFLVESGPNSLREGAAGLAELIAELGLAGERVDAPQVGRRSLIVRRGALWPLPDSPGALASSGLFTLPAKLRLLKEPFVRRAAAGGEESVADFVRRRLGAEVLDYAVNPLVAGIFGGEPEGLSVRYALPGLYALERQHGSLARGRLAARRGRRRRADGPPGAGSRSGVFSFRNGLQAFTDALCSRLAGALRLRTPVTGVRPAASGWDVTVVQDDRPRTERFDAVVCAVPLHRLGGVGLETSIDLRPLAGVAYPPLSVLALGFRSEDVSHPLDAFGLMVPRAEPFRLLGALFSSTMFPDRAPAGHVLLTAFIGGARRPELAGEPADRLVQVAVEDLRTLVGVRGAPTFVRHVYWAQSIPQYGAEHDRVLATIDRLESRHPGLFLAGNYRSGVGVGDALRSGEAAARGVERLLRVG